MGQSRVLRLFLILAVSLGAQSLLARDRSAEFTAPFSLPGWAQTLPQPPAGTNPSQTVAAQALSVLDYIRQHVTQDSLDELEAKIPHYNRLENFGTWIKAAPDSCLDTRAQVLVRSADPDVEIKYAPTQCSVVKGLWHDPYAGVDFKLAKAVQIDHVVPLKHVYLTGASEWAPERRCYYANFLHNNFHLLAVSGHENMSKGDGGPERYLPPTDSFKCEYVADWMKVKAIWQLVATQPELDAIENVIQTNHCEESKFQMTDAEMQSERDATNDLPQRCKDFGAGLPASVTLPSPLN